jgi:predicted RNA-binding Zn-ribbon protein involved in translation (DUF1610 family)
MPRQTPTKKAVSKQQLRPEQALNIACPTCGAAAGKRCELSTGQKRTKPHRDRRLLAKDKI